MIRFGRLVTASIAVALLAPAAASAESFDPSDEFKLKDWVPIHIGGLNLSINRAVVYLLVGSALTCLLGVGAGALIGWAASSFGAGLIIGAVIGLPAGVFAVYRRYRGYFS